MLEAGNQTDRVSDRGSRSLSIAALVFVAGAAIMGWGASFVGLHEYGMQSMAGFDYWSAWLVPATFDGAAFACTLMTYRSSINGRSAVRGRILMWAFTAVSSWINWIHQPSPQAQIVAAGLPIAAVAVFDVVLLELRADYEARHGKRGFRLRPGLLALRWAVDRIGTREAFRKQVMDIPVDEIAGLGPMSLPPEPHQSAAIAHREPATQESLTAAAQPAGEPAALVLNPEPTAGTPSERRPERTAEFSVPPVPTDAEAAATGAAGQNGPSGQEPDSPRDHEPDVRTSQVSANSVEDTSSAADSDSDRTDRVSDTSADEAPEMATSDGASNAKDENAADDDQSPEAADDSPGEPETTPEARSADDQQTVQIRIPADLRSSTARDSADSRSTEHVSGGTTPETGSSERTESTGGEKSGSSHDGAQTMSLPPVPDRPMSNQDKRTSARNDYRTSLELEQPVTGSQLGKRYGLSEQWGKRQINAAREDMKRENSALAGSKSN